MSGFRPGDRVRVVFDDVPVHAIHEDDEDMPEMTVYLDCEAGGCPVRLPHHWPMVTVERLTPAEWPPQPGDLWRDRTGLLWFAVESQCDDGVALTCTGRNRRPITDINDLYAPLTLVYRDRAGVEAPEVTP